MNHKYKQIITTQSQQHFLQTGWDHKNYNTITEITHTQQKLNSWDFCTILCTVYLVLTYLRGLIIREFHNTHPFHLPSLQTFSFLNQKVVSYFSISDFHLFCLDTYIQGVHDSPHTLDNGSFQCQLPDALAHLHNWNRSITINKKLFTSYKMY